MRVDLDGRCPLMRMCCAAEGECGGAGKGSDRGYGVLIGKQVGGVLLMRVKS